jgi:gliding motility-associated-like protein
MLLHINNPSQNCLGSLNITGSKSETNRLLLLQALYPGLTIENRSNSDDSVAMNHALTTDSSLIDIHHAGTAMRFLTAFFATQEGREIVLTGSSRMQERPIGVLVDALRRLGAQIAYEKKEGYPPLRISGKALKGGAVSLPANISSQYISALLLIAPHLEEGLNLSLEGEITSLPYLKMTLALLERVGVHSQFEDKNIKINQQRIIARAFVSTVLTPRSNGIEATWRIVNIEMYSYSMVKVFSPDGSLVFKDIQYQNDWKGAHYKTGKALPTGPYLYQIYIGEKQEPLTGWVYIFN